MGTRMKVLFVCPIEEGSGETVTAVHMGEELRREGHDVFYLASKFARKFIEPVLPGLSVELGSDGNANLEMWRMAIADFDPHAVIFADYPFLSLRHGVVTLGRMPEWPEALEQYRGCPITLDHFGFAQHEMGLFFGPPHLTTFQYQRFEAIPQRMKIILPCPMHEPQDVSGRRGHPFRYWKVPLSTSVAAKASVRRQYLDGEDGYLVFHSVPNWAWQAAEMMQISLYRYLPELLDRYLGELPKPVTVVSVNNGELLDPEAASRIRIVNLPPIPVSEFEPLLFGSDLIITENRLSISCGKAVCGFQICAAFVNRQSTLDLVSSPDATVRRVVAAMEGRRLASVYQFEVFPSGMTDLLREIILYQNNSLTSTFLDLEIFGGESTALMFRRLLTDEALKTELRARQEHYIGNLARLPNTCQVIAMLAQQEPAYGE